MEGAHPQSAAAGSHPETMVPASTRQASRHAVARAPAIAPPDRPGLPGSHDQSPRPESAEILITPRARAKPTISIVVSFFNEQENLPELLTRLRTVLGVLKDASEIRDYELIFVNDASTDESETILRAAARAGDVRLINMSRNFGVSPCVLAGLSRVRGQAVIYMDADLQDPPELIPELLRVWQADPEVEVVHTIRTARHGETRLKRAVTCLGYAILRTVSSIELPLEAGDFKLLSRRAARQLFLRGLVCWIGFKQASVPYQRDARYAGRTKFPVLGLKVIRNFLDSAVISFSDVPLKISTALGLLSSSAALFYIGWVVLEWYRGHNIPGWSATMVSTLFLGGIQLLSIGVLGNYLGSVFLESKRRPNFIVRDTVGFSTARRRAKARRKKRAAP